MDREHVGLQTRGKAVGEDAGPSGKVVVNGVVLLTPDSRKAPTTIIAD